MLINIEKGSLFVVLIVLISVVIVQFRSHSDAEIMPQTFAGGSSRLSELLSDEGLEGYAQAVDPRTFTFPADHGSHPEYRNEWWYVTGNLDGEQGARFGFELTIFRFSLTPPNSEAPEDVSAWRSNQVFIGHFALTDAAAGKFYVAERYSRGALGLAGATAQPFRVWLDDWSIAAARPDGEAVWRVQASDQDIALNLTLEPRKPPVLNGADGLSQKAAAAGNASYYYSITRLQSQGSIRIGERVFEVNGLSWLDREWGSSALSADQEGWDWFALQLADGSDLMFYNLRRNDGAQDVHSAGTLTLADGTAISLSHDDFMIEVLDTWQSPYGGRYPSVWQIAVAQYGLNIRVEPVLDAQELATVVRYWEGAVDVRGERNGTPISGRGYVELTGYADADRPRRPLTFETTQ